MKKKWLTACVCGLLSAALILPACGEATNPGGENPGGENPGGTTPGGQSGTITGTVEQTDFQTGFLRNAGEDDYGRAFTQTEAYGEKVVGVFYFLWLSQAAYDVTIDDWIARGKGEYTLTGDPDPDTGETVPSAPTFSWWGEPMYGYYKVEDKWVVRKHVELFMNAGLDFICFDVTNNDYYAGAAKAVLDVLLEYSKLGYKVPKAVFMCNHDSPGMIKNLYNAFYRRDTYDPIWFTGNGDKPWIIAAERNPDDNIMDRFYFKPVQWPWSYSENGFPWMDWNWPQNVYRDNENDYNIMSVSVSQHVGINGAGTNFSLSGLCSPYVFPTLSDGIKQALKGSYTSPVEELAETWYNANWGRGYDHETQKNSLDNAKKNINFEQQWDNAKTNDDINLVFVTGWNEWIAQRQSKDPKLGNGYGYYVDTYNMEFSRDIEMMKDGYLDNCYLQLVRNIREFNGVGSYQIETAALSSDVNLFDLSNWSNVPAYADLVKETDPRNSPGAGTNRYVNETGRNDISEVRVATTDDSLCFLITTVGDITEKAADDTRWMNLWIGLEGEEGGWNNLKYVVNRSLNGNKASIDKIENGGFAAAGECETYVSGRYMLVKIAKSALGISGNNFGIQFKVTDNLQADFDITDLYTNGDCAPIGRINYSYYAK